MLALVMTVASCQTCANPENNMHMEHRNFWHWLVTSRARAALPSMNNGHHLRYRWGVWAPCLSLLMLSTCHMTPASSRRLWWLGSGEETDNAKAIPFIPGNASNISGTDPILETPVTSVSHGESSNNASRRGRSLLHHRSMTDDPWDGPYYVSPIIAIGSILYNGERAQTCVCMYYMTRWKSLHACMHDVCVCACACMCVHVCASVSCVCTRVRVCIIGMCLHTCVCVLKYLYMYEWMCYASMCVWMYVHLTYVRRDSFICCSSYADVTHAHFMIHSVCTPIYLYYWCICMCSQVCVHVCIHTIQCKEMCVYVCLDVCLSVNILACMRACMRIHMYVCLFLYFWSVCM